jgi:hypothetical protein
MDSADIKERHILIKQNEAIIALLARSVIGAETIYQAVVRGKKNPAAYVRAYNALDGTIGVTDAAKVAGVSQPAMTPVLKDWEARGIVYNAGDFRRPLYRRLLALSEST